METIFEISKINGLDSFWAFVALVILIGCLVFFVKKKSKTIAQYIVVSVFALISLLHFVGTALDVKWQMEQYADYKSGSYSFVEGVISNIRIHGTKTLSITVGSKELIYDSVFGGCLAGNVRSYLSEGTFYQIKYKQLDGSICFYEIKRKLNTIEG